MNYLKLLAVLLLTVPGLSVYSQKKVLIFSKTTGFRHESIPKGVKTVTQLLEAEQIKTVHTENAAYFCSDSLAKFDAVLFLSTTGDIFNAEQKSAFQSFIRSGKGFIGVHAATDTEHNWPWYGQLVGGYFASHPAVQNAKIDVVDNKHPATAQLPAVWWHKDEWYDFKNVQPGLHILMTLDEKSYADGKMGKFHPIAWFQTFDGGRMFYTGLGHTDAAYDVAAFQQHIVGGVKYVLQVD